MRMTIVGSNPRAGGSECVVFGRLGADHSFIPVSPKARSGGDEDFATQGGWEVRPMRPAPALADALALVGRAQGDSCRITGRLVLVSHDWSGVLQINDIGRKYTVDLYSPTTRLTLLDAVHEVLVDVTALATTVNGALALPPLPPQAIVEHIVDHDAWFRFLDRDADFEPGPWRRTVEAFRPSKGAALKMRLMSALLPKLALRAAAPLAGATEVPARMRDELRLLAAAVEGLSLRARV
jgi:hypothetical protein